MAGELSPDQIAQLLAGGRGGNYSGHFREFLSSGAQGVDVAEAWPEYAGKKPNTVRQGFQKIKESKDAPAGAENVRVLTSQEKVYLVNTGASANGTEAAQ